MSEIQNIEDTLDRWDRLFRALPAILKEFGDPEALPTGSGHGQFRIAPVAEAVAALNRAFDEFAGMMEPQ